LTAHVLVVVVPHQGEVYAAPQAVSAVVAQKSVKESVVVEQL